MFLKAKNSIRDKLFRGQVFAILLCICLLCVVGYFFLLDILFDYHLQRMKLHAENFSHDIERQLDDYRSMLERVETLDYHRNYREPPLVKHFSKFHKVLPVLSFLNEEGGEEVKVINGEKSDTLLQVGKQSWFQKAFDHKNAVFVSDIMPIPELQELGINMLNLRVNYFGDEFMGVLRAAIPLRKIVREMDKVTLGGRAVILLLDTEGRIALAHGGLMMSSLIGQRLNPPEEDELGKRKFVLLNALGQQGLVAGHDLPEMGWRIVTFLPKEEFMEYPRQMLLLLVGMACLVLLLSAYMARRFANPIIDNIKRAVEHTERVAAGNLESKLSISSGDELQGLAFSINAMTESIARSASEQQSLNSLLQSIIDPLIVVNHEGRVVKANGPARNLFRMTAEQMSGVVFGSFFPDDQLLGNDAELRKKLQKEIMRNYETSLQRGEGATLHVLVSSSLVDADRPEDSGLLIIIKDISELKSAEDRIRQLAYYDPLTLLPNRTLLLNRIEHAILQARGQGDKAKFSFALLFLDLDRFKIVNDTLGHQVGDKLLVAVSERLKDSLRRGDTISRFREEDTIARLGGDEFIVMLHGVKGPRDAANVAQRILDRLAKPFQIDQYQLYSPASIGISMFPEDGTDVDLLLKNADVAMYHAKSMGRNIYQFFSDNMNVLAKNRLQVENRLRQAVQEGKGFILYYQPKISLKNGRISSAEALLRWVDDELGFVSPADFIPIAEDTGLIVKLGELVLRMACEQIKIWRERGLVDFYVAVNLSGRQIKFEGLEATVADCLAASGIPPASLQLELTESTLIESAEHNLETLFKLKRLGTTLAIDDFGTGYSSLAYLKRFPIDVIKIDRAFIKEMQPASDDEAIVRATIVMAHSLNLKVVAEGVEEQVHIDMLREMGCEEVQGFFYSPPVPAEKFEAFWDSNAAKQPETATVS